MRSIASYFLFPVAFTPKDLPRFADPLRVALRHYQIDWHRHTLDDPDEDVHELIDATEDVFEFEDLDDQGIRGPMTEEARPLVAIIRRVETLYVDNVPAEYRVREVLWINGIRIGSVISDGGGVLLRCEEGDDGSLYPDKDCHEELRRFDRGLTRVRNAIKAVEEAEEQLRLPEPAPAKATKAAKAHPAVTDLSFALPVGASPDQALIHRTIMRVLQELGLAHSGGCRVFYTPAEWKERGEEYGLDATLIVVHDGGAHAQCFNYDENHYGAIETMRRALMGIGYYTESATSWYSAIYPVNKSVPL